MKRVHASSGRPVVAAVVVDVMAAGDTAAGVTVASEEAAVTSQSALPAGRCCRVRCLSGFALATNLILRAQNSARYSSHWANLGRAGFEPAKA